MKWINKTFKTWTLVLVLLTGLVLTGCEGTDLEQRTDGSVLAAPDVEAHSARSI